MVSIFTGITGGDASEPVTISQRPVAPAQVKTLIGPKLFRQGTGNSKALSRKLRDMRY